MNLDLDRDIFVSDHWDPGAWATLQEKRAYMEDLILRTLRIGYDVNLAVPTVGVIK